MKIKHVLCASKSDSVYNIRVSKCHLRSFYCHESNCNGDTVQVQKDGYRINITFVESIIRRRVE